LDKATAWDQIQLLHLLGQMAAAGDQVARRTLKDAVFAEITEPSEDEEFIVEEWSRLQTLDEFLVLARIAGSRLLSDPHASAPVGSIPEERKQEFREALLEHARVEPALQMYQEYLRERGWLQDHDGPIDRDAIRRESCERHRREYPLERMIKDAEGKEGSYPGRYAYFGQHATKQELGLAYAKFLTAQDPEVQMRLLWVFRRAPLPEADETVMRLANGPHEGLRAAAIAALGQIQDDSVHQLARHKLSRRELLGVDNEALVLLHKNYVKSDAVLIQSALEAIKPSRDDAHALGYDLIELSKAQADSTLIGTLKWVYENTPCMHCRYRALIELRKYDGVSEEIARELEFDADDSIRELAQGRA